MSDGPSPHFAGGTLGPHRHVCAFFNGVDEQRRVLKAFITAGLEQREKAFHLVDPDHRDAHLEWLAEAGIDLRGTITSGQLEVRSWQEGPLDGGRFDQMRWLASLEQVLQSGPEAGYARTRFLAEMEWALVDLPGTEDLIEFETHVNDVILRYDDVVICAYDLAQFGAGVVIDALRTHPAVIIGGLLQENPFFVPPEQLLNELRERRSTGESTDAR